MANGQYVGVNGVARKVTSPYIGVEGVARNVKSGYVGVDGVARLFFAPDDGGAVVLEVEKVTSDTYANETTYTAEEFILLDIYPKPYGTVNVTYGGLTKTITDTSGAEKPNAQRVFFGTFNGVTDAVATPASGELTIEGDYYTFGTTLFTKAKLTYVHSKCITAIKSFGMPTVVTAQAFTDCYKLTNANIPNSVTEIGMFAFSGCTSLMSVTIPASVTAIDSNPFYETDCNNIITVDSKNTNYKIDGDCLIEIATNNLISGFGNSIIPSYVTVVLNGSFAGQKGLTSVTIPAGVTEIGNGAFNGCTGLTQIIVLATTPPTLGTNVFVDCPASIVVPKGCGNTYKAAENWSTWADIIVEAS